MHMELTIENNSRKAYQTFFIWLMFYFICVGVISLSYFLLEQKLIIGRLLFWTGIVGLGMVTIFTLIFYRSSLQLNIIILFAYGIFIFLPIYIFSPNWPVFQDEVYHFQHAQIINDSGRALKGLEGTLKIFNYYPGLELLGIIFAKTSGLSIFYAGRWTVLLAHSFILIFIFLIINKFSSSNYISLIGAFIFSVNASYVFFDCVFAYESIGIFLFVLILYLLICNNKSKYRISFSLLIIITMFSLIITHHFSSYHLGLFIIITSIVSIWNQRNKIAETKFLTILLLYFVLVFSWIIYVAVLTLKYFNGILGERIKALLTLSLFEIRESFRVAPLPLFELIVNRYLYTFLIVCGCLFCLYLFYKERCEAKSSQRNIVLSLLIYGPFLFLLTLPLTLKEGAEPIYRSWPFFFTGVSFAIAVSANYVLLKINETKRNLKVFYRLVILTCFGIVVMGGYNLGAGLNLLSRPAEQYASGPESITADVFSSAKWFKDNIGSNQTIFGDKTVSWIFGDIQNISLQDSSKIFLSKEINQEYSFLPLKYYIVIDRRITEKLARYQTYFEGKLPLSMPGIPQYGFKEPLAKEYIDKFNKSKILTNMYHNGNICIFLHQVKG